MLLCFSEERRQSVLEQRRIAKEKRLAEDMAVWEAEILDPALSNGQNGGDAWNSRIRENPKLRAMWFRGVPSHFRGRAWSLAIGNDLTLSKGKHPSVEAICVVLMPSPHQTPTDNTIPARLAQLKHSDFLAISSKQLITTRGARCPSSRYFSPEVPCTRT